MQIAGLKFIVYLCFSSTSSLERKGQKTVSACLQQRKRPGSDAEHAVQTCQKWVLHPYNEAQRIAHTEMCVARSAREASRAITSEQVLLLSSRHTKNRQVPHVISHHGVLHLVLYSPLCHRSEIRVSVSPLSCAVAVNHVSNTFIEGSSVSKRGPLPLEKSISCESALYFASGMQHLPGECDGEGGPVRAQIWSALLRSPFLPGLCEGLALTCGWWC